MKFRIITKKTLRYLLKILERKSYVLRLLFLAYCVQLSSYEIVIQPDYWTGSQCLENGVPWQVPDSIYKEDTVCQREDMVLEFGAGGSTIFFSKRCKHVLSIETDPNWALLVQQKLDSLNLKNVTLICIENQLDIERFLQDFETHHISILSVDTVYGYNRSAFLNGFLQKGISENLRMIVLDNYAASELFKEHYDKEAVSLEEWAVFKYDDEHWYGNGTKMYIRKLQ